MSMATERTSGSSLKTLIGEVPVGNVCLFAAGASSALMGAYHIELPGRMHWDDAMIDVPGMVTWGLFVINFDLSVLFMLLGLLTIVIACSRSDAGVIKSVAVLVPTIFWTIHAIYLRIETMPIPDALLAMRIALEGFTILMVALHWLGAFTIFRQSKPAVPIRRGVVAVLGTLGAGVMMGGVVVVIVLSMPTMKPADNSENVISSRSSVQTVAPADRTLADELGLASLADLTQAGSWQRITQGTEITDLIFMEHWPALASLITISDEQSLVDSLQTRDDHGARNLLSQLLRAQGDHEGARTVINAALIAEPTEPLHVLQSGYCYLAQMAEEESPMGRWALSLKIQKDFERALAGDFTLHDARYYLVFTFERAPVGYGGDRLRAMQLLDEAIEAGHVRFLPVRALFHLQRGEHDKGLADTEAALTAGWYHDGTYVLAAEIALEKSQTDDALAFATFAVRMAPNDASCWAVLATVLHVRDDNDHAINALNRAIKLQPENPKFVRMLEEYSRHPIEED